MSQKVNQKLHRLVSTSYAATLLKAVLHFDFVNTFGQKPCTLHAHFTQSYSALDTLPNHYYSLLLILIISTYVSELAVLSPFIIALNIHKLVTFAESREICIYVNYNVI